VRIRLCQCVAIFLYSGRTDLSCARDKYARDSSFKLADRSRSRLHSERISLDRAPDFDRDFDASRIASSRREIEQRFLAFVARRSTRALVRFRASRILARLINAGKDLSDGAPDEGASSMGK